MRKIPRVISQARTDSCKKSKFTHFLTQLPDSCSDTYEYKVVIGRRSGLKIRRPQGHGGSPPPPGTNQINNLANQRIFGCVFLCPNCAQS